MHQNQNLCQVASSLLSDNVQVGTCEQQQNHYQKPFPLVYEAKSPVNFVNLQELFLKHHSSIIQLASQYGAVLFKGFDIASPEEWASVLAKSGLKEEPYIGGAAVRKLIVGSESGELKNIQVVTTNESPSSQVIPFHHELAQTPNPPSHIAFYCQVNSITGGSTPVVRSDVVYDYLSEKHPEILKKFENGVQYTRRVPEVDNHGSAIGRSWKSMFNVQTRAQAEAELKKQNYSWQWVQIEDNSFDCIITSQVLPAIKESSNGKKAFFNQVVAAYTGWTDARNSYGKSVHFADGSSIPENFIEDLVKYMHSIEVAFKWQPGTFIIIDNTVTYHSRQSFTGRRQILAAIANGTKEVNFKQVSFALSNGNQMPAVGLGLWKLPKDKCEETIYKAVKAGYRLLDGACDYGNEQQVGAGIKKVISEGLVKREELFITSKLWNTYHRKEHVRPACLRTLKDLGVDYLDLYLIHFPIALQYVPFEERYPPEWTVHGTPQQQPDMIEDKVPYFETWRAMEELVREGLVKSIGVSNITTSQIRDVLSYAEIKPQVLQVELHPYLTQDNLVKYCRQKGIAVTGFSTFGVISYVEFGANAGESIMNEKVVQEIAKKHNKTAAQVLLRWGVQRGTAVIPKTTSEERLKENIDIHSFSLSHEEMNQISSLNKGRRYNNPGVFCEAAWGNFCPIYD